MCSRIRRPIPLALALLALGSIPSIARAQGNTFNPYGNSGYADYREFGSPKYATSPALPGQALLNGEPVITRPRPNSFQAYTDELNGVDSGGSTRGRALPGETYFQAYQRMNSRYNRVYKPNDSPENRKFEERQRQRDALYAKALEEKDPAKRAELLRQVRLDSVTRPANSARPKAAAGAAGTPPSRVTPAPAPLSRAPSPFSAPSAGQRRSPAPSPFSSPRPPAGPNAPREAIRPAPSPYRALSPEAPAPRSDAAARPEATDRPAPNPADTPIPPPR